MVKAVMAWVEAHVTISAELANELSDQLTSLGAQAVTFKDAGDQPIYEPSSEAPPLWHETIVIGLFDETQALEPILHFLEAQQALGQFKNFHLHHLEDEDWERRCLENFKPICFGKRLWICPSWLTPPDPKAVNVTLDPGLAFGTGTHPTTGLCLEWLDENITTQKQVIDYGCGSGILSIAALKLGAQQVLAIDNDPQALTATRDNAERNHILETQLKTHLPNEVPEPQGDLVIANILANPLIELAPHFAKMLKPGGKIVLSGILHEQAKDVIAIYNSWFIMENLVQRDEWIRLVGMRK